MSDETPTYPASGKLDSRSRLIECIEEHLEPLLGSISLYARRMGLDAGGDARDLAVEILQETVMEALTHADRFTATQPPLAWLRGIALNVIRRKKVEQAKHARREILLSHLTAQQPSSHSEEDVLDRLMPISEAAANPELVLESEEAVEDILSLVSPDDQEVVRLVVLEDCKRGTLAQWLGIEVSTARQRLHRALHRLRSAWVRQQEQAQKGGHDEETE